MRVGQPRGAARGGRLGLAELLSSSCLLGSSVLAELFAEQVSSKLGLDQFFRPLHGSTNRYDFSSSATLDRASVFGDPVILVAVGLDFILSGNIPQQESPSFQVNSLTWKLIIIFF